MGSCISKCRPNKKQPLARLNLVQDKLVISRPPLTTPPLSLANKISPYPPSPSASTSSVSSFTCVSTNTTHSSVSSTSSATSGFISKERLFSDEFLWSCYRENPHVIRINSLKANTLSSPAKGLRLNSPARSVSEVVRQPTPHRVSRSTPQKRVRSTSPTPATNLTRQKSFKKEQPADRPSPAYSLSNRALRSPSPSRRSFSGEKCRVVPSGTVLKDRDDPRRTVGVKANEIGSVSSSMRKEHVRPARAGPNSNNTSQSQACSMNKETCIHRISSKIDETAVGEALSNHDFDSDIPMEDIDNPLISLDCFIFL